MVKRAQKRTFVPSRDVTPRFHFYPKMVTFDLFGVIRGMGRRRGFVERSRSELGRERVGVVVSCNTRPTMAKMVTGSPGA